MDYKNRGKAGVFEDFRSEGMVSNQLKHLYGHIGGVIEGLD